LAIAPLGLVLAGHYATGSYADGAVLAGTYSVTEALAAPILGRRLDRGELRSGLRRALWGGAIGVSALLIGTVAHAPLGALVAATIVAAGFPAAVQGGFRAFVPAILPDHVHLVFALDASIIEIQWLSATALVAVVTLLGLPYLAIVAMLVATVAAAAGTALLPTLETPATSRATGSGWSTAVSHSYLVSAVQGYLEGTVTVALAPLLVGLGTRAGLSGILLAGLGVTSAVSGLCFGTVSSRLRAGYTAQATVVTILLGLLAFPMAAAPSTLVAGLAVAAFGLPIAPMNALRTQLVALGAPPERRSEAFATQYSAFHVSWGLSGLTVAALLGPVGAGGAIAIAGAIAVTVAVAMALRSHPIRRAGAGADTDGMRVQDGDAG
jgi:hypothetical protein